jgi:hypothetical protein
MDVTEFNKRVDAMKLEFENQFKAVVQSKTPVRTGAMRAGWIWDRSEQLHVFTNLMDYAGYVENGTEFQRPQMMVATTVLEAPEILKQAAKTVGL